jgi:hypothetical protein
MNVANIEMLWARVTARRFLFDKTVRTDVLKDNRAAPRRRLCRGVVKGAATLYHTFHLDVFSTKP